ncbi:YheC/YheD family protein [Proteinivorax hydrogeniformans]|uniref:YheC/YheD family protein n=1 Tax=Proteinivorax hydrogeniformans TaxID=1826727 RepID=A0AAU8HV31_9FIRM
MQRKNTRPVMAVLISRKTMNKLEKGNAHYRLEYLARANKYVNIDLCFCSINGINMENHKIIGMSLSNEKGKWEEKHIPFPDVLYMRGGVGAKNKGKFGKFIEYLKKENCILLNYPNFNKLDTFNKLNSEPTTKRYLPDTIHYTGPKDLEKMLALYDTVYLKAHVGRKGKNVLKVKKTSLFGYQLSYYRYNSKKKRGLLVSRNYENIKALVQPLYRFFKDKPFIIQAGIDLIEFNDRKVDMRAEIQRNKYGEVELFAISARLGSPRAPITTHSNAHEFETFLHKQLNFSQGRVEKLKKNVENFLRNVHKVVEKHYGTYAELGIDFAIDKNDRIWFIECNSQSTKVSVEKAFSKEKYNQSFINVLEYAKYRFEKEKPTS